MKFRKGPFPIIFLQVVFLAFWLFPADILAVNSTECLECHKKYTDNQFKQTYIHKPFLQKKCNYCHIPDWVDNAAESDGKAQFPHKIKNLGSGQNPGHIHLFSIPKELEPNMLFIDANNGKDNPFKTKLKIPPFDSLKTLSSDATPPKITKIQVIEVNRTNPVKAKIKWETDKLASSTFYYGIGNPDLHATTSSSTCYMSEHFIELVNLQPDQTYKYKVQAEDIYGNTRESTVGSFTTKKSFTLNEPNENFHGPLRLESDIYRSENNYLVRIKSTQPVTIEIATYDMASFPLLREMSAGSPANHPPLKSNYETNLLICENCHQATSNNFSHPAHFRAKLGTNIPLEYPRLPNGQISCLTCHFPHASNNQFHLRQSASRTLCIGCHKRSFRNR